MKLRFLILAVYFFALSLMPCTDVHSEHDEIALTMEQAADNHKHNNDLCSPLCVCSCCGSSVTHVFYPATFNNIVPVTSQDFPVYHTSFISEVYFNIWQPPKIS